MVEGAVLFGINPSAINVRKAKYTIGKKVNMEWDEEKHAAKGKKYFNEEKQKWFCKDCFEKYIEINQGLKCEEEIYHLSSIPSTNKHKYAATMIFYKTKDPNPVFTFDEGMIKIGKCRLDIGQEYDSYKDRKIKTIMKFGGTFIDVTAIHIKTGITVKTTLDFD